MQKPDTNGPHNVTGGPSSVIQAKRRRALSDNGSGNSETFPKYQRGHYICVSRMYYRTLKPHNDIKEFGSEQELIIIEPDIDNDENDISETYESEFALDSEDDDESLLDADTCKETTDEENLEYVSIFETDDEDEAEEIINEFEMEDPYRLFEKEEKFASPDISDTVKLYLNEIGQYRLLSKEEELELAKRIAEGDKEAKTILTNANLRLVVSVAKKYANHGVPLMDLIQEGNIGLMHAIDKFDYTLGNRFTTYAIHWIRQAVTRAISDQSKTIRIPVHMTDKISRMHHVMRYLEQELGRRPTPDEISKEMGGDITTAKVIEMMRYSSEIISIDTPISQDDTTSVSEFIEDTTTLRPEESTRQGAIKEVVDKMLSGLSEREALVVRLRNGVGYDRKYTLREVGDILGVTRERVRQIEEKSIEKLKTQKGVGEVIMMLFG